jgi:hypothetical protein
MPGVVMVSGGITGCGLTPLLGMLKKVKNTTQQITDQSLSLVSVVKIWNMSLQNTCLTIWKATVYYMIFNMKFEFV